MTGAAPVVLVHGAWHDGRCWADVQRELEGRGRRSVAVDLPSEEPGLGAAAYAEVVSDAVARIAPDGEPCVLVGHSLGGLTVPVAAQSLGPERVASLVLVAAFVPQPGTSHDERRRADPGLLVPGFGGGQRRHDDRTTSWDRDAATAELYRGVAEEVPDGEARVAAAAATLRRQAWTVTREVTPLVRWPDVPATVVVCAGDRVVDPGRLRAQAGALPRTTIVELPGGHFPMLTRPARLAELF